MPFFYKFFSIYLRLFDNWEYVVLSLVYKIAHVSDWTYWSAKLFPYRIISKVYICFMHI